jgi:methionine biosynthesis protein MetW
MPDTHSTLSVSPSRVDLLMIADMVPEGSRVLDVGCGDGALLHLLSAYRKVDGRGIEISQKGVNECVAKGLAVVQGDADSDLVDYPDSAFDFVILSQTLQAIEKPREVLEHMLRIGKRAIVSFPNFAHWRVRLELLFRGRMPTSRALPFEWYNTPNIHLCSIGDFVDLCKTLGIDIESAVALDRHGRPVGVSAPWWFWNIFGEQAVFRLVRRDARS